MLWLTEDVERIPQLDLELVYGDGIMLSPGQEEIFHSFYGFVHSMTGVAQDLTSLEQWVEKMPVKSKNIKVRQKIKNEIIENIY